MGRNSLLSQIRTGTELQHVEQEQETTEQNELDSPCVGFSTIEEHRRVPCPDLEPLFVRRNLTHEQFLSIFPRSLVGILLMILCIFIAIVPFEILNHLYFGHQDYALVLWVPRVIIYLAFFVYLCSYFILSIEMAPESFSEGLKKRGTLKEMILFIRKTNPTVSICSFNEERVEKREYVSSTQLSGLRQARYDVKVDTEVRDTSLESIPVNTIDVSAYDNKLDMYIQLNEQLEENPRSYFPCNLLSAPFLRLSIKTCIYPVNEETAQHLQDAKEYYRQTKKTTCADINYSDCLPETEMLFQIRPVSPLSYLLFSRITFVVSTILCINWLHKLLMDRMTISHEYVSKKSITVEYPQQYQMKKK